MSAKDRWDVTVEEGQKRIEARKSAERKVRKLISSSKRVERDSLKKMIARIEQSIQKFTKSAEEQPDLADGLKKMVASLQAQKEELHKAIDNLDATYKAALDEALQKIRDV